MSKEEVKVIKITPTLKQLEAYRACETNRIVLYGGAIRGGKSYFLCLYAFTVAFKYPKSRWLFLRESMPTLKRTLLVTFNKLLDSGFRQYLESWNEQTMVVKLKNGSEFIFMAESYDTDKELNRFRGLEINGAFIDEVNEIQEETFNKVIERSGSWFGSTGCPIKIVCTANPSQNWLKTKIYDKWKNNELPVGMAYVPAKITDNPYIPKEYLDSLDSLPRYQYEVFVEGNWDISLKMGGEFYKCFELDKHVGNCKYDPSQPLHISFDDNVNPYLPCGVFQIFNVGGGVREVRMIDEIAGVNPNNTVKAVCAEFVRRYQGHRAGLFIYGDATARKDDTKMEKGYDFFKLIMGYLESYRPVLRVLGGNPSVVMRGNWLNTVLEKEIGGIKVMIDESCKKMINDYINTKEDENGKKNKEIEVNSVTKVRYQKVGHFLDLWEYMMCSAFAMEFIRYQYGINEVGINVLPMRKVKSITKNKY